MLRLVTFVANNNEGLAQAGLCKSLGILTKPKTAIEVPFFSKDVIPLLHQGGGKLGTSK
jgi:hypothetical protein